MFCERYHMVFKNLKISCKVTVNLIIWSHCLGIIKQTENYNRVSLRMKPLLLRYILKTKCYG